MARIAQSRWDALVKRDFEAAYNLMSPAARTIVALETFQRKSGLVTWKEAAVKGVECKAEDLCSVSVAAKYAYVLRIGKAVENDHFVTETWRNVAGNWWYVPADLQ